MSREANSPKVPRIGGFVLAGGRSSRMGTDKALLTLNGRPLIARALAKLVGIAAAPAILAGTSPGNPALGAFAPLIFDIHPGCGPIGGIEAALTASAHPWNLILPVDVPLLPRQLLTWWVDHTLADPTSATRIALFRTADRIQPSVLLLHRDALASITRSIHQGEYKLLQVLESAARSLGNDREPQDLSALTITPVPSATDLLVQPSAEIPPEPLWFANLNNPQEFEELNNRIAPTPDIL